MLYNTENPHGGDVYCGDIELDFSANVNPFGVPEAVKEAVRACLDGLSHYPDPYCRRLAAAIAAHESVPTEHLLCGAGAAELIYSFASAVRPGKAVELAPTFAEYSLPLGGAEVKRFYLTEENGFRLTERFLDFIKAAEPEAVFVCDPNNPTGLAAEPSLIEAAAEVCGAVGARLLLDECFMDLSDEGESFVPKLDKYPNVTVLKAFTKSFGMAGLRLGYCMTADDELLLKMSRAAQPWNVSIPAQEAGIAALKERRFIESTRELISRERKRIAEALRGMGLRVFDSNANFLLIKGAPGLDEALIKRGIRIRSCANFYGLTDEFYRIAVKLPEENDRLLTALKECLTWQGT